MRLNRILCHPESDIKIMTLDYINTKLTQTKRYIANNGFPFKLEDMTFLIGRNELKEIDNMRYSSNYFDSGNPENRIDLIKLFNLNVLPIDKDDCFEICWIPKI